MLTDDGNVKRGLCCWVLQTCVQFAKTDVAEHLPALMWKKIPPEHPAVGWGDIQLSKLPFFFIFALEPALFCNYCMSGEVSDIFGSIRAAAHG